jgi:hypothetical protein
MNMIEQMSREEEVSLILEDIFDGDNEAQETCIQQLAEMHDLVYSEMNQDEIEELIIENEETLYSLSMAA